MENQELLNKIADRSRELTNRDLNEVNILRPREELNNKIIKQCNNTSRGNEDESAPSTSSISLGRKSEEIVSQEEEGIMQSAARTNSSRFAGLEVQHARTKRGVKVYIRLQTVDQAQVPEVSMITAELKRDSRLRELSKPYNSDSPEFTSLISGLIEEIRSSENRKSICIGRLHERNQRSSWVADMIMVGRLGANDHLDQVMFFCEDEQITIDLTETLTARQQQFYHASGSWGQITTSRQAPTLATLKSRRV